MEKRKIWIISGFFSLFCSFLFLFAVFTGVLFDHSSGPAVDIGKYREQDSAEFRAYQKSHRINIITKQDKKKIFLQKPREYWVFFYQEDCPFCEDIEPSIRWFVKNTGKEIFFVDTGLATADLFSEEASWPAGANTWRLEGVPSLAVIRDNKGTDLLSGSEEIAEFLLEKGDVY